MDFTTAARDRWALAPDEERMPALRDIAKEQVEASIEYGDGNTRAALLEALICNVLWAALDPEAEDGDEGLMTTILQAAKMADELDLHWRSGR